MHLTHCEKFSNPCTAHVPFQEEMGQNSTKIKADFFGTRPLKNLPLWLRKTPLWVKLFRNALHTQVLFFYWLIRDSYLNESEKEAKYFRGGASVASTAWPQGGGWDRFAQILLPKSSHNQLTILSTRWQWKGPINFWDASGSAAPAQMDGPNWMKLWHINFIIISFILY